MTTLQQAIQTCEIEHPSFKEMLQKVCERIDSALDGGTPRVSSVIGPSRIGKSRLILALRRKYPMTLAGGKRRVPFACAEVDSSTTPKELPLVVLEGLGGPVPRTRQSLKTLTEFMYSQIELADCKVMAYDEASHVVSPGARVEPYAAAQWFKQTQTKAAITQLFFGVPRLNRLWDADSQFRLRCYVPLVWRPYDPVDPKEREAFTTVVNTFLALFRGAGWTFADGLQVLASNCYLHAAGQIGSLSDLMMELARRLEGHPFRAIALTDFAEASRSLERPGSQSYSPFQSQNVPIVHLNEVYRRWLEENGIPRSAPAAPHGAA
jgi:hypothetical protein